MAKQGFLKLTYSLEDVAKMSGNVSTETVRNWINTGKLRASKIGKTYIVKAYDYDQFLEKHKVRVASI